MPPTAPRHTQVRPARQTGTLAAILFFGPLLALLAVLAGYFATRDQADWVLVVAFVLAAAAAGARLAGALLSRRSE